MSDVRAGNSVPASGIDSRILAHLLTEAIDLLEEAQFHAAIEDHDEASNRVLSNAISQIAGICAWLTEQMNTSGAAGSSRIQMTIHSYDEFGPEISDSLRALCSQVDRLHDRACKLDSLLREEPEADEATPRRNAEIIAFPGAGTTRSAGMNAVLHSQSQLSEVFQQA